MAAGDLLTRPGQVEWAGLLIESDRAAAYWLSGDSEHQGWSPVWEAEDPATAAGAAPGRPVPAALYPALIGVCVEAAAGLRTLADAMVPGMASAPLCWWDRSRDQRLTAPALARRCEPVTDAGVQLLPHRVVDLQWMIPRPRDIGVLS